MRRWLLVIVAVALFVRVGFLLADTHPSESSSLSSVHGLMARNLVDHGRWFELDRRTTRHVSREQARRGELIDPEEIDFAPFDRRADFEPEVLEPPGEAAVTAVLWAATGSQRYAWVQAVQIALDVLMVLLVFWIAVRLYANRRAGLIAAATYAVCLPIAALVRVPHLDSWGAVFTVTITAVFLRALDAERRLPWLLLTGLTVGAAAYFRPGALLLPMALGLAAMPSVGRRRGLIAAAVPLTVAALLLVPWTIRNAVEFDRFIPVRIGVGQNLWEGLGEINNDFGAILDDRVTEQQVRAQAPELRYGTPEYDDHLREKAYEAIADHPGHYAKVIGRRLVVSTVALHNATWIEATDPSLTDDPRVEPGHAITRVWDLVRLTVYALLEPVLFLIAVVVFAATWRSLWRRHVFLVAVVAATLAPYMVLHVEARYVLACLFVYMIALGLAADWGLRRLRERSGRLAATT